MNAEIRDSFAAFRKEAFIEACLFHSVTCKIKLYKYINIAILGGILMKKILIVDEEKHIREVISEYAQFNGLNLTLPATDLKLLKNASQTTMIL